MEGKLFALLGLKWKDEKAFWRRVSYYRSLNSTASLANCGCDIVWPPEQKSVTAIVQEIERGSYDRWRGELMRWLAAAERAGAEDHARRAESESTKNQGLHSPLEKMH